MCWICLFLAIALEVAATVFMRLSDGFTRVIPTVAMVLLYVSSFGPLTFALRRLEVGAVYAIWSAVGTAAVAALGILLFHESASALKVASIALIILGVVCLNYSMRDPQASRPPKQALTSALRITDMSSKAIPAETPVATGAVAPRR